jgi:hypothetical protein
LWHVKKFWAKNAIKKIKELPSFNFWGTLCMGKVVGSMMTLIIGYYVIGPNTNFSSESNGLHAVHARGVKGENPNVVCGSEENTPC